MCVGLSVGDVAARLLALNYFRGRRALVVLTDSSYRATWRYPSFQSLQHILSIIRL